MVINWKNIHRNHGFIFRSKDYQINLKRMIPHFMCDAHVWYVELCYRGHESKWDSPDELYACVYSLKAFICMTGFMLNAPYMPIVSQPEADSEEFTRCYQVSVLPLIDQRHLFECNTELFQYYLSLHQSLHQSLHHPGSTYDPSSPQA